MIVSMTVMVVAVMVVAMMVVAMMVVAVMLAVSVAMNEATGMGVTMRHARLDSEL